MTWPSKAQDVLAVRYFAGSTIRIWTIKEAYQFALLSEVKLQRKIVARKSPFTSRPVSTLVISSPIVLSTPLPPPIMQEANKPQTWNCFKYAGEGHIASQCPSRQVNTVLHGDATSDEEHVDEIEMEAKDAETWLMKVIIKLDGRVDMLSIQIIPEDSKVADGESWKRTSGFSTTVICQGRSCSLFINNDNVLNSVFQEFVSQFGLSTEPIKQP